MRRNGWQVPRGELMVLVAAVALGFNGDDRDLRIVMMMENKSDREKWWLWRRHDMGCIARKTWGRIQRKHLRRRSAKKDESQIVRHMTETRCSGEEGTRRISAYSERRLPCVNATDGGDTRLRSRGHFLSRSWKPYHFVLDPSQIYKKTAENSLSTARSLSHFIRLHRRTEPSLIVLSLKPKLRNHCRIVLVSSHRDAKVCHFFSWCYLSLLILAWRCYNNDMV